MNTQENNILEEMRRQMAILQAKLDKETIINDRLLRESMKNNYSSINRYLNASVECPPADSTRRLPNYRWRVQSVVEADYRNVRALYYYHDL